VIRTFDFLVASVVTLSAAILGPGLPSAADDYGFWDLRISI
jgi:hypothetical protein